MKWVLLAVLVSGGAAALACPTCGSGDPTLTAVGEEQSVAAQGRGAAEESIGSDARGAGADWLQRTDTRTRLALSYAPARDFSLVVDMSVLWRTVTFSDGSRLHLSGLGDGEAQARWTFYRDRAFAANALAAVSVGTLVPMAALARDAAGVPLDWRVQLGAGSWEPEAAVSTLRRFDSVELSGALSGVWPAAGRLGVTPGRSARATLAAQDELNAHLALRLALDFRYDEAWRVGPAVDPDSGGFVAYATPELLVVPARDVTLSLSVREPVLEALRGAQSHGTLYRLSATVDL